MAAVGLRQQRIDTHIPKEAVVHGSKRVGDVEVVHIQALSGPIAWARTQKDAAQFAIVKAARDMLFNQQHQLAIDPHRDAAVGLSGRALHQLQLNVVPSACTKRDWGLGHLLYPLPSAPHDQSKTAILMRSNPVRPLAGGLGHADQLLFVACRWPAQCRADGKRAPRRQVFFVATKRPLGSSRFWNAQRKGRGPTPGDAACQRRKHIHLATR